MPKINYIDFLGAKSLMKWMDLLFLHLRVNI